MNYVDHDLSRCSATVLAVVVAYLPEPDALRALVLALLEQSANVFVIDNSPAEDDRAWKYISDLCYSESGIRLVRCGNNLGIAAALNIGIEVALREGFQHVLLSDQDSEPEPGMVRTLCHVHDKLAAKGVRVGCVAPEYFDRTTAQVFPFQVSKPDKFFYASAGGESAKPWLEILTTITSGSLLPRTALIDVGPMREEFFIDHVDSEWCHRARHRGFLIFGTSLTRLNHRLGDGFFRIWYRKWRNYSEYSPARLYYRFRNFVLLCRLPYVPARWKVRAAWYWTASFYAHTVFSRTRWKNFWMIARGVWDGICGRTGALR